MPLYAGNVCFVMFFQCKLSHHSDLVQRHMRLRAMDCMFEYKLEAFVRVGIMEFNRYLMDCDRSDRFYGSVVY